MTTATKVTLRKVKPFLSINIDYQLKGLSKAPILLRGEPGIGKTAYIKDVADERKMGFLYVSGIKPLEFFSGLPLTSAMEGGRDVHTSWAVPELIVEANKLADKDEYKNTGVVVFLDDIHLLGASEKYFFELILERSLNNHKLRDNVVFVAAANNSESAGSSGFLSAIINRFAILDVVQTYKDWYSDFGYKINTDISKFMESNPNYISQEERTDSPFGTYRSWTELAMTATGLYEMHLKNGTSSGNDEGTNKYAADLGVFAQAYISADAALNLKQFILARKRFDFDGILTSKKAIKDEINLNMGSIDQSIFSSIVRYADTEQKTKKIIDFVNYLYANENVLLECRVQMILEIAILAKPRATQRDAEYVKLQRHWSTQIAEGKFDPKIIKDVNDFISNR
jgi:hypothetical protein